MNSGYKKIIPEFAGKPFPATLPPERFWVVNRKNGTKGYPYRFPVPDEKVSWEVAFPEYKPVLIEDHPNLMKGLEKGEALPADITEVPADQMLSYHDLLLDDQGIVLNPLGRTGARGGFLYKIGGSFTADPIVLFPNLKGDKLILLVVKKRGNSGKVHLPGGMVDAGEHVSETLSRELGEETGVTQSFEDATPVYAGIVPDNRSVDERWPETIAAYTLLEAGHGCGLKFAPTDTEEIERVEPFLLTPKTSFKLVSGHMHFVSLALRDFASKNQKWDSYCKSLIDASALRD